MWLETAYVAAMAITLWLGTQFADFLTTISVYAWLGFGYLIIQLIWFISLVRRYQRTL